jgi:drug/metabolite transporter (DMT)-like permease
MTATLFAIVAIALWGSLATLNVRVSGLSPFLSVGVSLLVGGIIGLFRVREWRVSARTFAVGVGGIFGYHALLFAAFRLAPAVEVNLVNYLWPLLIVLLSPVFLPGFGLRPFHIVGALLGLAGATLIASGAGLGAAPAAPNTLAGYLLAALAALIWAAYSLLTKRLPPFPTGAVGGFCFVSGLLSLAIYFIETAMSGTPPSRIDHAQWVSLALLGMGPMGGAFYAWDAALKRGDPRVIGSLSYITPLLSTLLLVIVGGKKLSFVAAAAMVLIVAGAALGSFDLIRDALRGMVSKRAGMQKTTHWPPSAKR